MTERLTMTEKAVCYIRVSTPKQKRQSPTKQWEYIQEYYKDKGWQGIHPKLREVEIILEDSFTTVIEFKEPSENKASTIKFEAVGVFFEDESAWERNIPGHRQKKQRSAFREMLAYVKKHKVKHVLTCWTNRLYRNTEDMIELKNVMYEIADGDFFPYLHLIVEQDAFSWANPDDYIRFTAHETRVVQSKQDSYEKSKHARRGKERAFKEGGLTYKAPPGYKNIKEQGIAKAVINEETAPLLKKMFKLIDEDPEMTTRKLALKMGELGLNNPKTGEFYHYGTIQKLLKNKFYIGQINYKGEWTESQVHEGIIPEPLFWRVQDRLSSRNLLLRKHEEGKKNFYVSPFASLYKCHFCGKSIITYQYPWRPKKGEPKFYTYLKCSSGRAHSKNKESRNWYINQSRKENWLEKYGKEATGPTCIQLHHREELIENLMDLEIQKLFFEDAIIEHFEIILKQDSEKAREEISKELTALKAEKAKLETQKKGYINMKARELISDEEFLALRSELNTKLEKIQIELSKIQQNVNQFEENIEFTCYILETLKNKWFTLCRQEKAEIFRMMTCYRELGNEKTGKLLIKWEKPWDALSLILEGIDGVGKCGLDRLIAHCHDRDHKSEEC